MKYFGTPNLEIFFGTPNLEKDELLEHLILDGFVGTPNLEKSGEKRKRTPNLKI